MFNGGLYIPESLLVYFNNIIVSINNNTVFYSIIREPLDTAADKDDDITSVILKYSSINLPQVTKIKRGYKIRKIIIDPGHGGKDPGAVSYSGKVYEKNIVLNVAKVLKQYLEKILPNVSVMLTRETDEFLSLNQRSYIANKNNGDLFISLHCNSGFKNAQGYEIYYFSLTEDDETERTVRLFENSVYDKYEKSETKKLNTVDFIKTDLAQINHINESIDFAHYVENELSKKIIANNRGLRKARFYVLKDVFMPSVLIELGFLSNPKEEKLLNNKSYQNKICLGIAEAIKKYKNKVESIQYEIQN
jgi:N-acetylmuramoyl-L-alanine amidase